jgi:hypothetical protein
VKFLRRTSNLLRRKICDGSSSFQATKMIVKILSFNSGNYRAWLLSHNMSRIKSNKVGMLHAVLFRMFIKASHTVSNITVRSRTGNTDHDIQEIQGNVYVT